MKQLSGKTILISGVLGDIAQETITQMKTLGAYVIGFDKITTTDSNKLKYLDEFYQCDIDKLEDQTYLKKHIQQEIDVIINNIGEGYSKNILETTIEDMNYLFSQNCLSAYRTSHLFLEKMINNNQGLIINISSILALHPVPTLTAYATSKAALIGLTKSMAIELSEYNIRVNCLELGYCDTSNNRDYFEGSYGKNFINRFIPLKKLVDKKSVGELIAFLSTDSTKYMTGSTIRIDSGETIW